jgi:hypothetical protein
MTEQTPDTTVQDVVNAITFLVNTFKFGKTLVGEKFSILNFTQDSAIIKEAEAAFSFVGSFPAVKRELLGSMTTDQIGQITQALQTNGVIPAGTSASAWISALTPIIALVENVI